MFRLFLLTTAAAMLVTAPTSAQDVEYGSIAVVPFGSSVRTDSASESARILTGSAEEGLRESGRFMAVLERSAAMDAAIQNEIDRAESSDSWDSAIRINTESQMNAKYLLAGNIERYEVTQDPGGSTYDAKIVLRLRIVDVETRAVIVNESLEITNQVLNNSTGGGGVGRWIRRRASDAVGSMDTTPEDAINTVYENASVAVRKMVEQNVSLLLIDYEVDGDDQVTELILLRAPDLDDDTKLLVSFRAPNRMGGGFRMRDIGKARIKSLDSEYAYAEITDGSDEITEALNRDPFAVVVRPEDD